MKTIGNILWFIFGGIEMAIAQFIVGAIFCITIIGIPVGLQLFKMARFTIWPFGKTVTKVKPSGLKAVLNIIWAILFGWAMALIYSLVSFIALPSSASLSAVNGSRWHISFYYH